jgi:hypothetical protein
MIYSNYYIRISNSFRFSVHGNNVIQDHSQSIPRLADLPHYIPWTYCLVHRNQMGYIQDSLAFQADSDETRSACRVLCL